MVHVARHVKTSCISLKMYLISNGERVESRFDGVVDISVWAAMRESCITSDLRLERLGLVFYRFKGANTSPTDRADCPADGAYNAADSLWNELNCFV